MNEFQDDINAVQAIGAVPSILEVVCRTTGMGFAAVARVTDGNWVACAVQDEIGFGLAPGGELPVATTICQEVRASAKPVLIDHVDASELFRDHPTPKLYGFQSYVSMPIVRADGSFFGTLCAIDPKPAAVSRPEIGMMFRLFGELIAFHLDAADRIAAGVEALDEARRTSDLREQFIALLGHDLRNPLAAVESGMSLIERSGELGERNQRILGMMRDSTRRAAGLISDVLDFARGRLGGGISVKRAQMADLRALLEGAAGEVRARGAQAEILLAVEADCALSCDGARLAQMLTNLIENAVLHGEAGAPVRVNARREGEEVLIAIANTGRPIPEPMLTRLFEPFFRSAEAAGREGLGLGLGLYIADQIARAHGGSIAVRSDERETVLSVRLPGR